MVLVSRHYTITLKFFCFQIETLTVLYGPGLLYISMGQVARLSSSAKLSGPLALSVTRLSFYLKLTPVLSSVVIYNQSIDMLGL
jgi:hypothetical protein